MLVSWMVLLLHCLGAVASATQGSRYYVPPVGADVSAVEIYLTTAGVGHEVNDRFGHTGIRVLDPRYGTDVVFNWGQFSFDDPAFLWKFFRGQLTYSMGVHSLASEIKAYREMDRRLVMERLNLTTKQKHQLLSKIAWNAAPEHRSFSYQYWFKNCSTIPRDYLDDVLAGQLAKATQETPAGRVFRDYVRGNLAYTPLVVPVLDVLMNERIDRPISAWDDMFLPANLRRWLLKMPAVDDQGQIIPGQMLLGPTDVLVDLDEVFVPLVPDYLLIMLLLVLPLMMAAGYLWMARGKSRPCTALTKAYRCLGFAAAYWGMTGGVLGLTLLINWGFSGHPDGWHNANLLLFWPCDVVFVALGVRLMRSGTPQRRLPLFGAFGRSFCYAHMASVLLLCLLAATGIITQNVWWAAGWFGLPFLGLLFMLSQFAFAQPALTPALAAERSNRFRRLLAFSKGA